MKEILRTPQKKKVRVTAVNRQTPEQERQMTLAIDAFLMEIVRQELCQKRGNNEQSH